MLAERMGGGDGRGHGNFGDHGGYRGFDLLDNWCARVGHIQGVDRSGSWGLGAGSGGTKVRPLVERVAKSNARMVDRVQKQRDLSEAKVTRH
jgi:hypothetical protein